MGKQADADLRVVLVLDQPVLFLRLFETETKDLKKWESIWVEEDLSFISHYSFCLLQRFGQAHCFLSRSSRVEGKDTVKTLEKN